MTDEEKALMTVELPAAEGPPTVAAAAAHLGVEPDAIDAAFGVIPIDPKRRLYALKLAPGRIAAAKRRVGKGLTGPFSDPPIGRGSAT